MEKSLLEAFGRHTAVFAQLRKVEAMVTKPTEQTLLEQLRITDAGVKQRLALLQWTAEDRALLRSLRDQIDAHVDDIVEVFYEELIRTEEIALLIGDADTLNRLRVIQKRYILELFSGQYGVEYVNRRLRIGLVHKRMGVSPKLYLAAVARLKMLLIDCIWKSRPDFEEGRRAIQALEKLIMFDTTLVFETYIRSMIAEVELAKEKSDLNAAALEETVRQRTRALEELTRTDARTGLRNARYLEEFLTRAVRAAERRAESLCVVFIDIDDFKGINDVHGHARGDVVLAQIGAAIRSVSRTEDGCFRYGGDEFCVVLPNCDESRARESYIVRLLAGIESRCAGISVSIGIAQTGPDDYGDPLELLHRADERMYAAKSSRRSADTRNAPPGPAECGPPPSETPSPPTPESDGQS